jgi:hypothetical protein
MVTIDGQNSTLRRVSRMSELIIVSSDSEYVYLMGLSNKLISTPEDGNRASFRKVVF